ncbi:MAG TPA: hypothetical protein VFC10_19330 [Terriglobia bacterium]|jgi:hypothetical protein|nr:hypothetical protein [Terriglobia bacterium]
MEPENSQLFGLLEERLRRIKGLALEIQAAQQACVSADFEALRMHDRCKERLCAEIRRLDNEIRSILRPSHPTTPVRRLLEVFVAGEGKENPTAIQRLRALLDESEAARAEVSKLNETYALFLARWRKVLNMMTNVFSHCMGVYPSLQPAAFRASSLERSY